MSDEDLVRRVLAAWAGYYALGNTVVDDPLARFVINPHVPDWDDANLACDVRASSKEEIDAVLARADEIYAGRDRRKFALDVVTPSAFEARLALEGYEPHPHLQLVLESELPGSGAAIDIRPVQSDGDWATLARLWRMDHEEEATKGQHEPWEVEVTMQMVAGVLRKSPDLQFWLARVDDEDAAFFSSWPGIDGLGIVEDLFTRPEFRGRGVATALITRAVADARKRGAGPIVISARPNDTPKQMYAALGFRPLCMQQSYVKRGFT